MAVPLILPCILMAAISRCRSEPLNGYNEDKFGNILKPPPPPPLTQLLPMPFHRGTERSQRQQANGGYQYEPPLIPPPPLPYSPNTDFKFPAPFYKQYNFNFVPPPQPFTTTPSASLFQKVSSWLFPSTEVQNNVAQNLNAGNDALPSKRECNMCNLVPWIPVIRYNVGAKSLKNPVPTYGPPSPTAHDIQVSSVAPPASYGPPSYSQNLNSLDVPSNTYGPPSPTQTLPISNQFESSFNQFQQPFAPIGLNVPSYELPSFSTPRPLYGLPERSQSETSSFHGISSTSSSELGLPHVDSPKGFRNSYGEPISHNSDNYYAASATPEGVTASNFVSSQYHKPGVIRINDSVELPDPAPFSLNKGRNIHTLQPVALPNLSVSPLPPIFNARPFRIMKAPRFPLDVVKGINHMQQKEEFVRKNYSTSLHPSRDNLNFNDQKQSYKGISNSFVIDAYRDISHQASEDHVLATKSNHEASFETTGGDDNDLPYIPLHIKPKSQFPSNHKHKFTDLRGMKDEDVDKFRSETNLQNIDSPLLYLKPSVPHKSYNEFTQNIFSTTRGKDYEAYEDISTTAIPYTSTLSVGWDEDKIGQSFSSPSAQEDANQPNILQIIIPYTTNENERPPHWLAEDEYQGRKAPTITENYNQATEIYTSSYDNIKDNNAETPDVTLNLLDTSAILNDLYDIKDPPFDIIKFQHNIDGWTEQEYSKRYKAPKKMLTNTKQAKNIPGQFFTTAFPLYDNDTNDYDDYSHDHESASSIQHFVSEIDNDTHPKYGNSNSIIWGDKKLLDRKKVSEEKPKPYIYTSVSSFRTSSVSSPSEKSMSEPWEKLETTISPLTKEKIYVVTSKPWRDPKNYTNLWYDILFESKKTNMDKVIATLGNTSARPPRFVNRPPIASREVFIKQPDRNSNSHKQADVRTDDSPSRGVSIISAQTDESISTETAETRES